MLIPLTYIHQDFLKIILNKDHEKLVARVGIVSFWGGLGGTKGMSTEGDYFRRRVIYIPPTWGKVAVPSPGWAFGSELPHKSFKNPSQLHLQVAEVNPGTCAMKVTWYARVGPE